MTRFAMAALIGAGLGVLAGPARGQPDPEAGESFDPTAGYNWKDAARRAGFGERDIEAIARNKVLVGNETYRQVFTPYRDPRMPLFITSDSLLNAFHVLFEESIRRLELENARRLPRLLRFIWDRLDEIEANVPENPGLAKAARTRARVAVGTALRLLGEETPKADKEVVEFIRTEVAKVHEARARDKSAWLGPPDRGFEAVDYSRFKPRGFYSHTDALQTYFRAVGWLQAIPFRVSRDEELLAILLLGGCLSIPNDDPRRKAIEELSHHNEFFYLLIGGQDNGGIQSAASEYESAAPQEAFRLDRAAALLPAIRKRIEAQAAEKGQGPQVYDLLRSPADPVERLGFRILPAYRTPDAVLFQRTGPLRGKLPNGLDLCVVLGSAFARSRLADGDRDRLLKLLDEHRERWSDPRLIDPSVYGMCLHALSALFGKPEPDAPAFMAGEPWAIKCCQTALGGWAQLRHAWSLQAKQSSTAPCAPPFMPPGFVEPAPEFFSRMARLVRATEQNLRRAGALKQDLESPAENIKELALLWRDLQMLCCRLEALAHKQLRRVPFTEEECGFLTSYGDYLGGVMLYGGNSYVNPLDDAPRVADVHHDQLTNRYLEVGVGRPRALYVLYPWKGGEVLCRGAVMPYYEFAHPQRLTDAEWKALLDAKDRPAQPEWLKPIQAREPVKPPKQE
jgi:hypothetical protein